MGFGLVEFGAKCCDVEVMDGVGLTVQLDAQDAVVDVGAQIDGGIHEAADEASGIVGAGEGFAGQMHHGRLGAVGDELDGVDEVLSAAAQLVDAPLGRKVFELDVFESVFALILEGGQQGLGGLQGDEGVAFL